MSGSGKSSLVFSTIAAESQKADQRNLSSLRATFHAPYGQPDADMLENISAAIIVDQQRLGGNSRSTVATVTDTSFDCRNRPSPSTCECCERLGSWNEQRESEAYGRNPETAMAIAAMKIEIVEHLLSP